MSRLRSSFEPAAGIMLAAALLACSDDGTGPDRSAGALRGSVTSAKTSEGIAGLVVALLRDGRVVRAVPTDAGGAFAIGELEAGEYDVRITGVELSALSPRHTAFEPAAQRITVGSGPVDLFIAAVGLIPPRIVGTVACGGTPVSGARLRVVGGATDIEVTTNAQGRYGATDLAPGAFAVLLVEAPCSVSPPFAAVSLISGQAAEVNFGG